MDKPLLERDDERQRLSSLVGSAMGGAGRLMLVRGRAGIGKTRLLGVTRAVALEAGMQVLTARCSDLESQFSFGAVRQLFDPIMVSRQARERLLVGAAARAAVLFGPEQPASSDDESFMIFHGLYWLAADLCGQRPVALFVDDLQWCDVASMRFLAYLQARMAELRLLVLGTVRTGEQAQSGMLLDQLLVAPDVEVLEPKPLSQAAVATLVHKWISANATEDFCRTFWRTTGGNPLLVRELATAAGEGRLPADEQGSAKLLELAPRAIGHRVSLQLAKLGSDALALARSVAVLGGAEIELAADLAGLAVREATAIADQLIDAQILRYEATLTFVHPLVRAAVYQQMSMIDRNTYHAAAADLVLAHDGSAEQVAAHLLQCSGPIGEPMVEVLRQAAANAASRGSPQSAVRYLERMLDAPLRPAQRCKASLQLGALLLQTDATKVETNLRKALDLADDPDDMAASAELLIRTLMYASRHEDSVAVAEAVIGRLGEDQIDKTQHLMGTFGHASLYDPALSEVTARHAAQVRRLPVSPGMGGRVLDCFVAIFDALTAQHPREAVERARRALAGKGLGRAVIYAEAWFTACCVLMASDLDEVMEHLDDAMAHARRAGSTTIMALTGTCRGVGLLWHGRLAEAELELRDAFQFSETAGLMINRPAMGWLSEALVDQGRVDDAMAPLHTALPDGEVPETGAWWWFMFSRGRVILAQRRWEEGVTAMLACGERYSAHGWSNPAYIPWRSHAAMGLHALGRTAEARRLVDEELSIARRWGQGRSIGNALRAAAAVGPDRDALDLLHESVRHLERSPARLDYARSLVALGAALLRAGDRAGAREFLTQGLHHASACGAKPLAAEARNAMHALGLRPRRGLLTGFEALTPASDGWPSWPPEGSATARSPKSCS